MCGSRKLAGKLECGWVGSSVKSKIWPITFVWIDNVILLGLSWHELEWLVRTHDQKLVFLLPPLLASHLSCHRARQILNRISFFFLRYGHSATLWTKMIAPTPPVFSLGERERDATDKPSAPTKKRKIDWYKQILAALFNPYQNPPQPVCFISNIHNTNTLPREACDRRDKPFPSWLPSVDLQNSVPAPNRVLLFQMTKQAAASASLCHSLRPYHLPSSQIPISQQ